MPTKTVVTQDDITIIEKTVKIVSTDPVAPVTDEFWYNSTSNQLKYYDGANIIVVGNHTQNYSTYPTPIDVNTPIDLTGTTNIDWSLGKIFYKPDVNGNISFTFSNTTDKEIIVVVEPTFNFYNFNLGVDINFPQPFYSDNYSGFNTTILSLPSPALYGLFYISSKNGKIYIKNYNVNSNQLPLTRQIQVWGQNNYGQLGQNDTNNRSSPVLVVGNHTFINITGGFNQSVGIKSDGSAWAWGRNNFGQLGNNSIVSRSSPILVQGSHSFNNIIGGYNQALGLKADGSTWVWGDNAFGQLGQNDTNNRSSPVLVVGNHTFINIAGGDIYSLGLKADGNVWAWGYNSEGELGHNDTPNRSSPVLVVGNHTFINIACGQYHSLGLKADGNVWAWGANDFGGLGQNTNTSYRSSPVLVVGSHSFINIACEYQYSLGLKADGTAWAWGYNSEGELGCNDSNPRSSPVLVVGGHSFVNIAGGYSHLFGLKVDGTLWAWGTNTYGQLGFADTNRRSSPVLVTGNYYSKITNSAGYFSLGIQR